MKHDCTKTCTNLSENVRIMCLFSTGLGAHQKIPFMRLDSQAKGYTNEEPHLELNCKFEHGYTYGFLIALKNPNGKRYLMSEQPKYIDSLK